MTNSRHLADNRQSAPELEAIGLPAVDAQVYELLVRHPHSSAVELAEHGDLGVQRVAQALARLVAAGLAQRVPGQPAAYTAGTPELVLGPLLAIREQELRAARSELGRLDEIYREASRVAHPAELIEVVTGTPNISQRIAQVQQSAREQILGFDKPPYLSPPGRNLGNEQRRLREGIRYRVIYDREAVALPGRLANDILPSLAQGEQARVRDRLPMKMFVADESLAVIPISSSRHVVDAAYVVHPCALLDALLALFEAEWQRGTPVSRTDDPTPEDCAPEYARELLPLLAAGQTDDGIARAMGWSPRTTQRRVQRLMTDLNASTRFQAGLAARYRGWL